MSSTTPYVAPPPRCVQPGALWHPHTLTFFLFLLDLNLALVLLRPAAEEKVAELREELASGASELDSIADDQSPEYRACGEPKFPPPQPRR